MAREGPQVSALQRSSLVVRDCEGVAIVWRERRFIEKGTETARAGEEGQRGWEGKGKGNGSMQRSV